MGIESHNGINNLRKRVKERGKEQKKRRETGERKKVNEILTAGAVVSLPSGQTDALAGRRAPVVAKVVVAWPAQVLAALAVVMRRAGHPVLVHHHRMVRTVLVLNPLRSNVQPALRRQTRYYYSIGAASATP